MCVLLMELELELMLLVPLLSLPLMLGKYQRDLPSLAKVGNVARRKTLWQLCGGCVVDASHECDGDTHTCCVCVSE